MFFNNNKSLIMYGSILAIHYYAFINVNLTFCNIDTSTNKKYLSDSNFEKHFLREKFWNVFFEMHLFREQFLGNNIEVIFFEKIQKF